MQEEVPTATRRSGQSTSKCLQPSWKFRLSVSDFLPHFRHHLSTLSNPKIMSNAQRTLRPFGPRRRRVVHPHHITQPVEYWLLEGALRSAMQTKAVEIDGSILVMTRPSKSFAEFQYLPGLFSCGSKTRPFSEKQSYSRCCNIPILYRACPRDGSVMVASTGFLKCRTASASGLPTIVIQADFVDILLERKPGERTISLSQT